MSMLAQHRGEQLAGRRISSESLIVYGLFVVTLVLLVASAVTGWREAHRDPGLAGAAPAGVAKPVLTKL